MNIDWKAVAKNLITAIVVILSAFGVIVPEWLIPYLISGLVIIMTFLPSIIGKKKE
jgi:hypothetical protein